LAGGVVWGGRTLASAFVVLCALLADHSHPADASLATPGSSFSTPHFTTRTASDFNVTIGGKPRATQARDLKQIGSSSSSEAASAAKAVPTSNNRQRIVFVSRVIADPRTSAAIFRVT